MVHRQFLEHFGGLLATYATLSKLPPGESMENPRISSLVHINARVLYFWEGQQVFCTDLETCRRTPGWDRPWGGLAFGAPLPLGERALEPACLASSWEQTVSAHPDRVVKRLKRWALSLRRASSESTPACFPPGAAVPAAHTPTLLYWADGQVTLSEAENHMQRLLLGHAKSLFTRGEGFNLRSSAERSNYLLLVWFMKRGARAMFTQPNIIAHDFLQPVIVHRIIEAMQEQQDCGWAMTCKSTGSCWAASLLGQDGACRPESEVVAILEAHAAAHGMSTFWKMVLGFWLCVAMAVMGALVRCLVLRKRGAPPQPQKPAVRAIPNEPTPVALAAAPSGVAGSARARAPPSTSGHPGPG
mmetsp:Transcript_119389/g.371012  ORF Transcript_119389/g.371012 Transcript_119389/m.371012 type:complete len:358 (-) Transcript_119389:295-1368(-)